MLAGALLGGMGTRAAADEAVRVERLARADAWVLADGRTIRLASVVVPDLPVELPARALALVAPLAEGRRLRLAGGERADRYGRMLGTLVDAAGQDPRLLLLRAGLAVVRCGDEPEAAVRVLLAAERDGRSSGRGIWGELDRAQATPVTVARRIGRFALVEGVAVAVKTSWDASYLDFGPDWRTDFGIRILKADLRRFVAAGLDPTTLTGRKLQVRGWPFQATGPMLELRDPLELQPLP